MKTISNVLLILVIVATTTLASQFKLMLMAAGNFGIAISILSVVVASLGLAILFIQNKSIKIKT